MALSFADSLAATGQMVAALTTNQTQVAERGITPQFVAQGQDAFEQAQALNIEQERLKAELKAKTVELETVLEELRRWNAEASSTVKLAYRGQPEKWIEFGITAKK